MNDKMLRERLLLPVLIPVGALAFVGFLAMAMASILLRVPHNVATAVALMVAFNLLVAFAVLALKPDIGRTLIGLMAAVAIFPVLLGAAAAAGVVPIEGAHEEEEKAGGGATVQIAANNLQFDKSELQVPADQEFELHFNNEEAQPHNVSILEAQGSSTAFVRGEVITGPDEATYRVDPIPAGNYYFQCDVHPNMSGTVVAA